MVYSRLAGREVSTWSEEWKHECEIAYLAAIPVGKRNVFLDGVQGGSGDERGIKVARRRSRLCAPQLIAMNRS